MRIFYDRKGRASVIYPSCCTSAFCGKVEPACRTCPRRKTLDEFNQWVKDHKAVCADEIWSPHIYVETA